MGLLDFLDTPDGQLGIGLLAAAGPSMTPVGLGQRLAQGLQYAQAQKKQAHDLAWQKLQQDRQRQAWNREDQIAQLAPQFFQPGTQGTPAIGGSAVTGQQDGILPSAGQPATPPKFDMAGYAQRVMAIDPSKGLPMLAALQKETPFDKIDPKAFTPQSLAKFSVTKNYGDLVPRDKLEFVEGVGVNPYDPTNANRAIPNANKPFSMSPSGEVVPNQAFQAYEINKARAGASNTSVKVENKMGESIAKEVGPILKESRDAANGAAQTVDAADRIIKAIDSNKVYAGPGATARLTLAQVGQVLGVGGKDEAEKISNTRQAIRGLAEMTLKGRQQMKGQGAITESESALAEKATSGDINSLTPAEIKQLANASARASRWIYGQHNDMLSTVSGNPDTKGLAAFYKPLAMPDTQAGVPQARVVDFGSLK